MCVDLEQSLRNHKKRENRRRFHRMRDTSREKGTVVRRAVAKRVKRLDPRPLVAPSGRDFQPYSTGAGLVRAAVQSRRDQDALDRQEFAARFPFAEEHAA